MKIKLTWMQSTSQKQAGNYEGRENEDNVVLKVKLFEGETQDPESIQRYTIHNIPK